MTTFELNMAEIVILRDSVPDMDGSNWVYTLLSGEPLTLPPHAGRKVAALGVRPGEEISIGRYQQTPGEPAEWVVALSARAEKDRAAAEIAEREREARELAAATRRDTAGQLAASLELAKRPGPVVVESAPASRRKSSSVGAPPRVSYRVAMREITVTVAALLRDTGEQWSRRS